MEKAFLFAISAALAVSASAAELEWHEFPALGAADSFDFRTDSDVVAVRWTASAGDTRCGDVYAKPENGGWNFKSLLAPDGRGIRWTPGDFGWVYLPRGCGGFAIGVRKGCTLEKGPRHASGLTGGQPLVFAGDTFVRGDGTTRPGLAFAAIVGRGMDSPVLNLGRAGGGLLDDAMLEEMARIDAAVYVVAVSRDLPPEGADARCEKFVRELRRRRPALPILVLEPYFAGEEPPVAGKVRAALDRLLADPVLKPLLIRVSAAEMRTGDGDDVVDEGHPNDYGSMRLGGVIGQKVRMAIAAGRTAPDVAQRKASRFSPGPDGLKQRAWRGETLAFPIPATAKVGAAPAGFTVRTGVARPVAYDLPPETVRVRPEAAVGGKGKAFDRVEWGGTGDGPLWAEIAVSADAKPGTYRFGDVELTVVDRTLPPPSEWKYHLDLWQHPWAVARYHGVKPFSGEHYALMEPLWRLLATAGQKTVTVTLVDQPWGHQCHDAYGTIVRRVRRADGGWAFDWTLFDEYVSFAFGCGLGPGISCYSMCPTNGRVSWFEADGSLQRRDLKPGTAEYDAWWTPFLKALEAHLKEKGWLKGAVIAMDERSPDDLRAISALLGRVAPGLGLALAGNRRPSEFSGVEIADYSQSFDHLDAPFLGEVPARRAKGRFTTFYVACGPWQPNTFLFSDPDDAFWLGYLPAALGLDGLLRWAYNSWPAAPESDGSWRDWAAGDAYLVYPNACPSTRFLLLRRGIAAAEKARILASSGAGEGLAELAKRYDVKASERKSDGDFADLIAETEALLNK